MSQADRDERLKKILEKAGSAREQLIKMAGRGRVVAPSEDVVEDQEQPGVNASSPEAFILEHAEESAFQAEQEEAARKAWEEALLQEKNAIEAADREAAEIQRLEDEKAEAERIEDEKLAAEKIAADQRAAEEERAAEIIRERQAKAAEEERLAREREELERKDKQEKEARKKAEEDALAESLAREEARQAELLRHQARLAEEARQKEIEEQKRAPEPAPAVESDGPVDDIQEDVLPIVLEEAQEELLPDIEAMLGRLVAKDKSVLPELHRKVHTLKGSLAMVGAMRARAMMHSMETWMEQAEAGEISPDEGHDRLLSLFEGVKDRVAALARGDHLLAPAKEEGRTAEASPVKVQAPRRVHLKSDDVDKYITEINEARLANVSMAASGTRARSILSDLDEKGQRLARLLRELEIHAETQIQSRRNQIEESGEEFDPLEFDRYTSLQEISRFLSEGLNDVVDLQREMVGQFAEQETVIAYQGRAIEGVQEGLQRTRLIPADALGDRLHKVVWATSRELGKATQFFLEGGRHALDRLLLERIASPLEHILRNSIAHGIEGEAERAAQRKPAAGSVHMEIRQEAGRVHIIVKDDGRGLDPDKIKQKAVSKGLWVASRPMTMADAADMICSAGFSTSDSVSEIAGRGVGMDVVRSEVMAMGGRFEIQSTTGQGMSISIVLPTAIASISVVLVEAGGETWAIPVEMVEHMDRITPEKVQEAMDNGHKIDWAIGSEVAHMRCRQLSDLMGVSNIDMGPSGALLVLRTGDQRAGIFVESLSGVSELPMRSLGRQWSSVPGVMGATILPDGRAGFLVDPLRADWSSVMDNQSLPAKREKPLILVVDDSITVRKVTARFLERHNYDAELAKDGQEAVEILVDMVPDVILLDVEMPRMDGFDCARHIRENPKLSDVPIIMITSRTADKHRQRALSMGVNAYLGKPFKEEELLPLLTQFTKQSPR